MARTTFKLNKTSTPAMSEQDIQKLISKKAFELYEKRGFQAGHSLEDWLEAERLVRGRFSRSR